MTRIERLRELSSAILDSKNDGGNLSDLLYDIAAQITCELREERDRWDRELCEAQMDKTSVMAVYLEMNKHILGHEGAEDSPVARWARELRYALKSDTSDERDAQKPSWHDTAEDAGVTSEAPKVTRDPAEDVSMSAYDLLPADEHDAIAWVREHGGIGGVERAIASLNDRIYRRQRQIDESHEALRRRNERIGFLVSELNRAHNENHEEFMRRAGDYTAFADEVCKRLAPELRYVEGCSKDVMDAALHALDRRLMPEGMEWPKVDGDPVVIGERMRSCGIDDCKVAGIDPENARLILASDDVEKGKATYFTDFAKYCHRPAPKVLDADGVEIEVGDDLYSVEGGLKLHVGCIDTRNGKIATAEMYALDKWADPAMYTHRAPVLAADGKPLLKGETVYRKNSPAAFIVDDIMNYSREGGAYVVHLKDGAWHRPQDLTHECPDSWERLEEDDAKSYIDYWGCGGVLCTECPAVIDGKRPWERFECDYYPEVSRSCTVAKARDLVRRAKALAERSTQSFVPWSERGQ